MDLLDSILNGMEKPPTIKKPIIKDKEKREKYEKMQKDREEAAKKQKDMLDKFRVELTRKVRSFVTVPTNEDSKTYKLTLKPMNKLYRSIVREVCEEHEEEIVVHSFGTEEVDRHCIIWKKGYEPCEAELRAMKLGVEYKPPKDDDEEDDNEQDNEKPTSSGSTNPDGKDKFWSKYEKIIGENASGVESARVVLPAKQYGCVPIENKKDQRSIEQMIDDIRKTKKQKTTGEADNKDQEPQQNVNVDPNADDDTTRTGVQNT